MAFFLALGFLVISCDSFFNENSDTEEGETETFYALDNRNSEKIYAYTLEAVKLAEGTHCVIWREKGGKVNRETAEGIAREFDTVIFPKITDAFGQSVTYRLDGEKKLEILLLNILDNYRDSSTPYIAGYFSQNDISRTYSEYSNNRTIIYMDTNPGLSSIGPASMKRLYTTMAHEFTHFLSYTIGLEKRPGVQFTTWIDEGLSAAAEYLYTGEDTDNKIEGFNEVNQFYLDNQRFDEESRITQGNNFFTWTYDDYIMDEYRTVYLFFQWLRIQTGTTKIYRDIITAPYADYQAVTAAAVKNINPSLNSWEKLLETWLWANRLNRKTELYGYRGEIDLVTAGISTPMMKLEPGEGVYSNLSGTKFTPSSSLEVLYSGMSATGEPIKGMRPPYSDGDMLLTFNGGGSSQSVALSGKGDDPQVAASTSSGRNAAGDLLSRPFPIDRVFRDSDVIIPQSQPDSGASQ